MLRLVVLGSAAGGGFPQWNANDEASRRARAGEAVARTQSSLAVSADGRRWVLLNASPDLRQQIHDRYQLHPPADAPRRSSPIAAVVLTNADVDHVAGLLTLRENHPFVLYAHSRVLDVLARNSIFDVLSPANVERRGLHLEERVALSDPSGEPLGVVVRAFAVPGKVALWLEKGRQPALQSNTGDTIGLEVWAGNSYGFFYIPGCAAMTPELAQRLHDARLVFFDGTLWRDDEMIVQGVGNKTGKRMGHMSCSGADGTIAAFENLGVQRKIFVHMNNTNPLLQGESAERLEAERAGWEVAFDGMEIEL